MVDKLLTVSYNNSNPDMSHWASLHNAAIGFMQSCAILYDEIHNKDNKVVLETVLLQTPYSTNLLMAVELLFKILLLSEGYELNKLRTHKIYNLYEKLNPITQNKIKNVIDGSHKHMYSLESVLKDNNDKLIRLRYNDLTKSHHLTFQGGDVLLHLALFLSDSLGISITKRGNVWRPNYL